VEKAILTRLASKVINTPLMILPDKLNVILSVIGNRIGVDESIDLITTEFKVPDRKEGEAAKNVSVIPVHGSLVYRTHGLNALSGLTSYDDIRNDFREAMESDSDAIIFDINSPGGEVHGLMDLVDEIYEARGGKPIYAMANESAYSAAYAIASAADKIFVSRTAGVGSVGVIAVHQDQSKFDEKLGVKYTSIFAGARKADFDPHQPLSDEAKGFLQDEVMDHYELFTQTVARNRGMKIAQVKATEAGLFTGEKAVSIGFADEVRPFSLTIEGEPFRENKTIRNARSDQPDNFTKEVKEMEFEQFSKEHPELLAEIVAKTTDDVTKELSKKFDKEKAILEEKLAQERDGHSDERKELKKEIAALQKSEAIRTEKELRFEARAIWTDKLNESSIPDRLADKVMNQVSHDEFVKDGELDREAFEKAIDAEIADWESRGIISETSGFGISVKEVEGDKAKKLKRDEADEDLAEQLFALSGGEKEVK